MALRGEIEVIKPSPLTKLYHELREICTEEQTICSIAKALQDSAEAVAIKESLSVKGRACHAIKA
jgi:hypothetical protein